MTTIETPMKIARIRSGMTQKRLSEISGVSMASLWNIENGVQNPSLLLLECLSDALGISIDEYVGHKARGKQNCK